MANIFQRFNLGALAQLAKQQLQLRGQNQIPANQLVPRPPSGQFPQQTGQFPQMAASTTPFAAGSGQAPVLGQPRPAGVVGQQQTALANTISSPVIAPPTQLQRTVPQQGITPQVNPQYEQLLNQLGSISTNFTEIQKQLAAENQARTFQETELRNKLEAENQARTFQESEDNRLRELEKAIIEAGQLSPEELGAQKQLNALLASFESGQQAITDKPIPMEFETGQRAALERRLTGQAAPLQRQLQLEQSKRQAALGVAKTRYGFEKERREFEKERREERIRIEEEKRRKSESAIEQSRKSRIDERQIALQEAKFEDDKRRFGLEYAQKQQELTRKAAGDVAGGLTPYQTISLRNQIEDNLRSNPAVKSYSELVNFGVPVVLERFNSGQADSVSDTILMRSLAKVTDPTTGVREEEYRTFETAIGALGQLITLPKKWIGKGRLTDEGRASMIREIQDRFNSRAKDYEEQYGYYKNQAGRYGLTVPPPFQSPQMGEQVNSDPLGIR